MGSRLAPFLACVLTACWLAAQTTPAPQPAPPAEAAAPAKQPAIVLLLREPRALDAERCRQGLARTLGVAVGTEPAAKGWWLAADGEGLRGGRDGIAWRVAAEAKAPIEDNAMRGLEPEERDRLATHGARLVVRTGPVEGTAALRAAYRALGGVAASLLDADVLGVGAAHHGTFVVHDAENPLRKDLASDDPLGALEPTAATHLVAFLRAPRTFDEKALAQVLSDELQKRFGTTASPVGKGTHCVVRFRSGYLVRIDKTNVVLTLLDPEPAPDEGEERPDDLRVRRALEDHKALLLVTTSGRDDEKAEPPRRRAVARVMAALWGDDVLAIRWHCDDTIVPTGQDLRAHLRSDDPVAASLGKPVVPILTADEDEASKVAMAKAIAEARATWKTGVDHFTAGGELSAKFPFAARKGGHEHIWLKVTKIDGDTVHGELGNEPFDVEGLKLGSAVTCKLTELSDWLYVREGKMVGGYTVRVFDEQAKRKAR